MKKIVSVVALTFVLLFGHASQSFAMSFTDVPDTHRFAPNINQLFNEGIIQGFGDDKFGPDQPVTRAAATIMLAKALDLDTSNTKTGFTDVSQSSKAAGAIQALKAKGKISGFPDGKFHPDRNVTRAEMAILLANAFELEEKTYFSFTDVSRHMKSYEAIQKVVAFGVAAGYTSEKFVPSEPLSRAQFSAFLSRAMSEEFRLTTKKPDVEKVTKEEAYAISSQLTAAFGEKVYELGKENNWNPSKPGTVEIGKPALKEYLTERYLEDQFKEFIESYYCDCDHLITPKMTERMIRFTLSEVTKNSFTVTGLYLSDFIVTEPHFHSITFKTEDGKWKIDSWKDKQVTTENLNLTIQEVEKALPEFRVTDEYYLEKVGSNVYEVNDVDVNEYSKPSAVSKKNGRIYTLD